MYRGLTSKLFTDKCWRVRDTQRVDDVRYVHDNWYDRVAGQDHRIRTRRAVHWRSLWELPVAFGRVEDDVDSRAEVVPGFREDADFEAPFGGKLEQVEP